MDASIYWDKFMELAWMYGPKAITALVLLIVGLWLIRRLSSGFQEFLKARKIDESLRPFFSSLVDVALKIALLLVVAGQIGIETTSFIAVFSAMAFAVGLALQGSLGNFASGVLILLFRPYKVGDFLTVGEFSGKVTEIQIFNTVLTTPENIKIIIPNGKMTEGPIRNIAEHAEVQAEIILLVHIGTSLEQLRAVVERIADACPYGLKDKSPEVYVSGISRDDMKVEISLWTTGQYYEDTIGYMNEVLKSALPENGIELAKERRKESVK
jgi:small conductance mechanosensitive channel